MFNLETENKIFKLGYKLIAGLDEAGRGPLAGPVVAACVIIDQNFTLNNKDLSLVRDSKKLSSKQRKELFSKIKNNVLALEIGLATEQEIDQINILQASFLAMRRALKKITVKPDYLLLDGRFKLPKTNINQSAIIKGDENIWVIAAASIIAKVSRDFMMQELDKKYPLYNFKQHKGYGTKEHLELIQKYGPCPAHRLSFRPCSKKIKD